MQSMFYYLLRLRCTRTVFFVFLVVFLRLYALIVGDILLIECF